MNSLDCPFRAKSIRFESDAPLDDIVVETDQDGWLLLQAKTKLSLSSSLTSEFGKTALQIVRQWHTGLAGKRARGWDRPLEIGHDRLIIAVGPGTSQTVTIDLAKTLSSLRAHATAPLPAKQRCVLTKLSATLKRVESRHRQEREQRRYGRNPAVYCGLRFDMAGPIAPPLSRRCDC